jgi:predicted DNA-binding protein (UPF0251 family)
LEDRLQQVPPALGAQLLALSWPEDTPLEDPELVATALTRLPVDDRIALHLHDVKEYSPEDAADFFERSRPAFLRLLDHARQRLLQEYQRLRDGAVAVAGLLAERALAAWRRVQAGMARAQSAMDQGLSRLSSLPVLDAFSATAALALVGALALGVGDEPVRATTPAKPATAVAWGTLMAARPVATPDGAVGRIEDPATVAVPSASTPATASAAGESEPSFPVAVAPPLPVAPVSKESRPYGDTSYRTDYKTTYEVDVQVEVPEPSPADASDVLPDEPIGVGAGVGYHCPPPDERPPPHAVACPVLEP